MSDRRRLADGRYGLQAEPQEESVHLAIEIGRVGASQDFGPIGPVFGGGAGDEGRGGEESALIEQVFADLDESHELPLVAHASVRMTS